MVTDDERREVARRLRALDYSDLQESLICAYLDALGIEGYADWVGIAQRLADLIERDDPPRNLYTLYEAVFHRSPRCWECIEDDEVDELVDALLDICNAPGHEHIQRPQPSCDRDALLALADRMEHMAGMGALLAAHGLAMAAASIREALGVES